MVITDQLTIPANTSVTDPVEDTIKVSKGKIKQVTIQFPPGCVNLVGIWFIYHGVKILPWNPEGILYGDSSTLVFDMDYATDTDPYELIVQAYNQDDIFDHTLYLTITHDTDIKERQAVLFPGGA